MRWRFFSGLAVLALIMAVVIISPAAAAPTSIPATAGRVRAPLLADPDGITETCNGSPQNYIYAPSPDHSPIRYGGFVTISGWYYTGCEGAPYGFIFRRVVVRGPPGFHVVDYWWVAHDGSHTKYGCAVNTVQGREGVYCNETTEINGAITNTNPGPVQVVFLAQATPCNVGVFFDDTLRKHYDPWPQVAYQGAWIAYNC